MTDLTKITEADPLPEAAREIVTVVGLESAMRLVSVYGGSTISFSDESRGPEVGGRRDIIAKLLGPQRAKAFFRHFANRILYVPRCSATLRLIRDRQICAAFDDGASVRELMAEHGLSERSISRILKDTVDPA